MGYRLPNAAKMYGISELNILMMDYRGFGKNSAAAFEFCSDMFKIKDIFLFGIQVRAVEFHLSMESMLMQIVSSSSQLSIHYCNGVRLCYLVGHWEGLWPFLCAIDIQI